MRSLKQFASQVAVNQVLSYVDKNPKENLAKLLSTSEKVVVNPRDLKAIKTLQSEMKKEKSPWIDLIYRFFDQTSPVNQNKFVNNFMVNSVVYGIDRRKKLMENMEVSIPWTILIDPTSKCNLKCTGCWAAEYDKTDELPFETIDRIITEGKELGIYVYLYSGGEPFVRIKDILSLCRKHDDCYFSCFTNGTLITEEIAKEIADVGNFAPGISIEGFENATDFRRGTGTFKRTLKGMEYLKKEGVMFGASLCYHHYNYQEIGSDEFFDFLIDCGAYFTWLFTYMPIGKDANTDLCCRPEEREFMYHKIREFRKTKPLFTMDFWNDGEFVEGCIAGGRNYFHINAHGDVEPCAFVHYSDTNINEVSLLEALHSPIFKAYQKRQPFNGNHLRPCPILDNPNMIVEMVNEAHAQSTQPVDKEPPESLKEKCSPIADRWGRTADVLWKEAHQKEKMYVRK
ncbi:MAG: radical SAM protein [Dethiosulfatibacter sp.]|nr:radical SAM protein [Dethiosulfatibacter sp.]